MGKSKLLRLKVQGWPVQLGARSSGTSEASRLRNLAFIRAVNVAVLALILLTMPMIAVAQPIPPPTGSISPEGNYAYSAKFSYDPDKCSRDAGGMIFFAIGRRVLRQPMANLAYSMGQSVSERRDGPQSLHPDEPWGCPDHPLQMAVYHLSHVSDVTGSAVSFDPDLARSFYVILHNGPPNRQDGLQALFCSDSATKDRSIPGMEGCYEPNCKKFRAYKTTDYTDADGKVLALVCMVSWPIGCDSKPLGCQGGYSVLESLTVNLSFSDWAVPLDEFIDADQLLRRRLKDSEVVGFLWADDTLSNWSTAP